MSRVAFVSSNNDNILYADIENKQLAIKNDYLWFQKPDKQTKELSKSYQEPKNFVPIGVNESYAIGVHMNKGLPELTQRLQLIEKHQFVKAWKAQLLQCQFLPKYDYYMSKLFDILKVDPLLKDAVESIIRDKDILDFKSKLPKEKPKENPEENPKNTEEKTKTCILKIYEEQTIDYTNLLLPESKFHSRLLVNRLTSKRNKGWKQTKIVIPTVDNDSCPASFYLYNHYVLISYYLSASLPIIRSTLYDLEDNYKVVFQVETYNMKGPPNCMTNGRFIIVSDGYSANVVDMVTYKTNKSYGSYTINGEIITACDINEKGEIMLGTYSGLYYRVSSKGLILFAFKQPEGLAITNIQHAADKVLIQTITSLNLVEGIIQRKITQWNAVRPIYATVHGGKVVLFSKYGITRILPLFSDQMETMIPLYKEITYDLNFVIPWYKALYISKDATYIYILHPEVQVIRKSN